MALDLGTAPTQRRPGFGCIVARIAAERGEDDAAALYAYMLDHAWSSRALSEALAHPVSGEPIAASSQVIRNHRNGLCTSCRDAGRS
jgi:hypothetical protein